MDNNITVSVFMITYNHEKFIAQALDSVLMQKVNFRYEIVLGEDCSTDNTREIVIKYAKLHPEKFKLILQKTNVGAIKNQNEVYANCTGKYIAMCEGDDYWTDPLKLQKQVDFMEMNENVNLIATKAKILNNDKFEEFPNKKFSYFFNFEEQTLSNQCATCTTLFRNYAFSVDELSNSMNLKIGDIFLWSLLLRDNKMGYYLNEETSIYRVHSEGVYSGISSKEKILNEIDVFNFMKKTDFFSRKEIIFFKAKLMNLWYDILLNHSKKNRIKPFLNVINNYSINNKRSFIILLKAIFKYLRYA